MKRRISCCCRQVMPRLNNLTSLDLSSNVWDPIDPTWRLLSETLASLPSLTRLDLSSNDMPDKLRQLLENIGQPLECLRIRYSGVTEADLFYLAASHHATALQQLDISDNWFRGQIGAVLVLLKAVAPTLNVLDMHDIGLEASEMDTLLAFCPMLTLLRFWTIGENDELRSDLMLEHAENIVRMPQLQAVQLSAPLDDQDEDMVIDNILPENNVQFIHMFTARVSMLCETADRPNIQVVDYIPRDDY